MLSRRLFVTLAILAGTAGRAAAKPPLLQLIMAERQGCEYCAAFRREVLPGYASSAEGRAVPLLPVPIDGPWPDGLALDRAPVTSPTFILVRSGMEVARFEGYDDPTTFRQDMRRALARV